MKIIPGEICPEMGQVGISNMKLKYTQPSDTGGGDSSIDFNELEVWIEDGGAGPYLAFSTDRWSVDLEDIDEICDILKDFKNRFEMQEE